MEAPGPLVEVHVHMDGASASQRSLARGTHVLGSSDDCDVQVAATGVSGRHARLTISPSGCFIEPDDQRQKSNRVGNQLENASVDGERPTIVPSSREAKSAR